MRPPSAVADSIRLVREYAITARCYRFIWERPRLELELAPEPTGFVPILKPMDTERRVLDTDLRGQLGETKRENLFVVACQTRYERDAFTPRNK